MKYINIKKVISILSTSFIVLSMSGCKTEKQVDSTNSDDNIEYEYNVDNEQDSQLSNDLIIYENKEEEIVSYFENLETIIDNYINQDNFEKIKESSKEMVVTGIDFIFYGKEIKGITFNELTDTTKEKIIEIVNNIDIKLENKIPGYKETIKDKFNQGYDYISEKLKEGSDYIDDKLESKYGLEYEKIKENAKEIKDEVKEDASDTFDLVQDKVSSGFTKIKNWYEEKTDKK